MYNIYMQIRVGNKNSSIVYSNIYAKYLNGCLLKLGNSNTYLKVTQSNTNPFINNRDVNK